MTIPNFTAELSLQPTCLQYVGMTTLVSYENHVSAAAFKIMQRGHVGYCCSCQGGGVHSACDCYACMSL